VLSPFLQKHAKIETWGRVLPFASSSSTNMRKGKTQDLTLFFWTLFFCVDKTQVMA